MNNKSCRHFNTSLTSEQFDYASFISILREKVKQPGPEVINFFHVQLS